MTEPQTKEQAILVIDDEEPIRDFLRISLAAHGFKVVEAENAHKGSLLARSCGAGAIILDLGLPDMDGMDLIRAIRQRTKTPIIVLSVRETEADKISALDNGADDYLVKPFGTGELLARLKAVMRRAAPEGQALFDKKGLLIDTEKRLVTKNGKAVHLSPTEFELLKLLALNDGKVLTHKHIYRKVWDKDETFAGIEHLLRVTISNLRNKIEPSPDRPAFILTEAGVGYRMNPDL